MKKILHSFHSSPFDQYGYKDFFKNIFRISILYAKD